MSRELLFGLLVAAFPLAFSLPASCEHEKVKENIGVIAEAKVMATPKIAFESVRAMRAEDPSGCKVLSASENESVVEELFDGLPVIGDAICVYQETYEPLKSISFHMIRSNKLKAFEGEWTFEPADEGRHTLVKLRTYIDTGLKIPLVKQLTHMAGSCEVKRQVAQLKCSAERKQNLVSSDKQNSI